MSSKPISRRNFMAAGATATAIVASPSILRAQTKEIFVGGPASPGLQDILFPVIEKKHGFKTLGPADGSVKRAIFGGNAARLYGLRAKTAQHGITSDRIAAIKAEYLAAGGARTNARYGYVARTMA